jgi:hypothetical protein
MRTAELKALRPEIATAAQRVYDEWAQDEEGLDEELGAGGICHLIADDVVGLLSREGFDAATVSAQVGEQHVWVVAQTDDGVYLVDIPPSVYESGSGYRWRKKPGVEFSGDDVVIDRESADPGDFERFLED